MSDITEQEIKFIQKQLGRPPEGLQEIVYRDSKKDPVVLRVTSIVRGKPFPNMYWLSDKSLCKAIDKIESHGFVKELENIIIPQNEILKEKINLNHQQYIQKRWNYFIAEHNIKTILPAYVESLKTKGIGGLSKFKRVRCLHMHYAHYLVDGNSIGELLEEKFNLAQHIS
ncbi:MAG: DUF501 domain-containing protein [Bacteriovoracaceae bacterium]|jgi:uncharacterized protein|nr:DUF501 domain-containing protein [Bacteriovoracaceae bacterium]